MIAHKILFNFIVTLLVLFVQTSCTKYSFDDLVVSSGKEISITTEVYISDPWTATSTRAISDTEPVFMCYLFDLEESSLNGSSSSLAYTISSDSFFLWESL